MNRRGPLSGIGIPGTGPGDGGTAVTLLIVLGDKVSDNLCAEARAAANTYGRQGQHMDAAHVVPGSRCMPDNEEAGGQMAYPR